MKRPVSMLFLLPGLVFSSLAFAENPDPPRLTHNPFSRPPSDVLVVPQSAAVSRDTTTQALDLKATMVGTRDKLANVDGEILRAGDEIHGYTLVEIFEDHAVFLRQGNRLTVHVNVDVEEDDE